MKVSSKDLSFCLNNFPGETWEECFSLIKNYCKELREILHSKGLISTNKAAIGLGLRLSFIASQELKKKVEIKRLKKFLKVHHCYIFTINAFPYGKFHQSRVKEQVYSPDWSSGKRLKYTKNIIKILKKVLPKKGTGSISTVPVCYGKKLPRNALGNLLKIEKVLKKQHLKSKKKIFLGLEPEPDCFLENTEDCLKFFSLLEKKYGRKLEYLGLCFDTCHFALAYENLKEAFTRLYKAKIRISKVQISSCLKLDFKGDNEKIGDFADEVYLHQTRVKKESGSIEKFKDLPEALKREGGLKGEWRIHFHVPLNFSSYKDSELASTSDLLSKEFLSFIWERCDHFEIETYTYFVLPNYKKDEIIKNIAEEYAFLIGRLSQETS